MKSWSKLFSISDLISSLSIFLKPLCRQHSSVLELHEALSRIRFLEKENAEQDKEVFFPDSLDISLQDNRTVLCIILFLSLTFCIFFGRLKSAKNTYPKLCCMLKPKQCSTNRRYKNNILCFISYFFWATLS